MTTTAKVKYENLIVGDDFIITNQATYKNETPYKGPFVITQCFSNDTVNLQYGATKIKPNIHHIKPYKSDTKVEYYNSINIYDDVTILLPVIYLCLNIKVCIRSI